MNLSKGRDKFGTQTQKEGENDRVFEKKPFQKEEKGKNKL